MALMSLVISGPRFHDLSTGQTYAPYDKEVVYPEEVKDIADAIFRMGYEQALLFQLEDACLGMAQPLPRVAESHGIPQRKLRRWCRLRLVPARLVDGEWWIGPSKQLCMRTQMEVDRRIRKRQREWERADPVRIACRNVEYLLTEYRGLVYGVSPLRGDAEMLSTVSDRLKTEIGKILDLMRCDDANPFAVSH
jgi:hypothetical protein